MRLNFNISAIPSKSYLVLGYIITAMIILSAIVFMQTRMLSVPTNDFMTIAWKPGQQLLHQGYVDTSYPYPLWTPILMLPFVLWSPEIGAQVWLFFNLFLLALSIVILIHALKWPFRLHIVVIASLLVGAYSPIFFSLWLGQLIFVSLLSLVLLVHALRSGSWTVVGVVLALSLIKPQVTILVTVGILGLAIWQRRWRVLAGFAAVLCLFVALAAPFAQTPRQILGGGVEEHLIKYLARTSTFWGLSLTLVEDWILLPLVVSCLLFAWLVYLWVHALRTGRWAQRIEYLIAITTIVNLLIVPYSWSYNLAILVFPVCYAIDQAWRLRPAARIAWLTALIALIYPFSNTVYTGLAAVYQSDVYQIIPVLCFLPLMVGLQYQADRTLKSPSIHMS